MISSGRHHHHQLHINEILDLAIHAYSTEQWPLALQWYQTALQQFQQNNNYVNISTTLNETEVMDDLAIAHYKTNNLEAARRITRELLTLQPHQQTRLQQNLDIFDREFAKRSNATGGEEEDQELTTREIIMMKYEKLCRGETRTPTTKQHHHLKCWYRFQNPLLRLKPQKVERLWVNPEIFLFHDILTDMQANWIKDTAYPMLERATIFDPDTGKMVSADYRVSKSAWMSMQDFPEVHELGLRIKAVTKLDLDYAEHLQIANYGMGGQYEPHFDHARETEAAYQDMEWGNRIATLLFYLTDVTAGGKWRLIF